MFNCLKNIKFNRLFKFKLIFCLQKTIKKKYLLKKFILRSNQKMNKKIQDCNKINSFLSNFTIMQHNDQSIIISSENSSYMIRNIQISSDKQTSSLNQIINTLTQHQQFNSKNILSLIDFQIVPSPNNQQNHIRAIYQYGKKNLLKQIQQRKLSEQYFQEDALWGLLYSISTPLSYLQQKNVIYGVIDPSRVFLDNGIKILDPSSTGINPYQIKNGVLYSPQLLKQQRCLQQVDMFKSDVFVLGLLMLQSSLLKIQLYQYDQSIIKICLSEIQDIYSKQYYNIISSLLIFDAAQRPTFKQVLKNLTDLFDISSIQIDSLQPLYPDKQDQQNQILNIEQQSQKQNIDILQSQTQLKQQNNHYYSLSQYQKAKLKFCSSSADSRITQESIEQSLQLSRNKSFAMEDIMVKSLQKSKKVYNPKQIKDKLIKYDYYYHSSSNDYKEIDKNHHKRSKTNNTIETQRIENDLNVSQIKSFRLVHDSKQKYNSSKRVHYQTDKQNHTISNINMLNNHKIETGRNSSTKGRNSSTKKAPHEEINLNNKQNLFTKPEIMNMIKNDIKKIQQRKRNGTTVHFNYMQKDHTTFNVGSTSMHGPINEHTRPNYTMSQQFNYGQLKPQHLTFNAIKNK